MGFSWELNPNNHRVAYEEKCRVVRALSRQDIEPYVDSLSALFMSQEVDFREIEHVESRKAAAELIGLEEADIHILLSWLDTVIDGLAISSLHRSRQDIALSCLLRYRMIEALEGIEAGIPPEDVIRRIDFQGRALLSTAPRGIDVLNNDEAIALGSYIKTAVLGFLKQTAPLDIFTDFVNRGDPEKLIDNPDKPFCWRLYSQFDQRGMGFLVGFALDILRLIDCADPNYLATVVLERLNPAIVFCFLACTPEVANEELLLSLLGNPFDAVASAAAYLLIKSVRRLIRSNEGDAREVTGLLQYDRPDAVLVLDRLESEHSATQLQCADLCDRFGRTVAEWSTNRAELLHCILSEYQLPPELKRPLLEWIGRTESLLEATVKHGISIEVGPMKWEVLWDLTLTAEERKRIDLVDIVSAHGALWWLVNETEDTYASPALIQLAMNGLQRLFAQHLSAEVEKFIKDVQERLLVLSNGRDRSGLTAFRRKVLMVTCAYVVATCGGNGKQRRFEIWREQLDWMIDLVRAECVTVATDNLLHHTARILINCAESIEEHEAVRELFRAAIYSVEFRHAWPHWLPNKMNARDAFIQPLLPDLATAGHFLLGTLHERKRSPGGWLQMVCVFLESGVQDIETLALERLAAGPRTRLSALCVGICTHASDDNVVRLAKKALGIPFINEGQRLLRRALMKILEARFLKTDWKLEWSDLSWVERIEKLNVCGFDDALMDQHFL